MDGEQQPAQPAGERPWAPDPVLLNRLRGRAERPGLLRLGAARALLARHRAMMPAVPLADAVARRIPPVAEASGSGRPVVTARPAPPVAEPAYRPLPTVVAASAQRAADPVRAGQITDAGAPRHLERPGPVVLGRFAAAARPISGSATGTARSGGAGPADSRRPGPVGARTAGQWDGAQGDGAQGDRAQGDGAKGQSLRGHSAHVPPTQVRAAWVRPVPGHPVQRSTAQDNAVPGAAAPERPTRGHPTREHPAARDAAGNSPVHGRTTGGITTGAVAGRPARPPTAQTVPGGLVPARPIEPDSGNTATPAPATGTVLPPAVAAPSHGPTTSARPAGPLHPATPRPGADRSDRTGLVPAPLAPPVVAPLRPRVAHSTAPALDAGPAAGAPDTLPVVVATHPAGGFGPAAATPATPDNRSRPGADAPALPVVPAQPPFSAEEVRRLVVRELARTAAPVGPAAPLPLPVPGTPPNVAAAHAAPRPEPVRANRVAERPHRPAPPVDIGRVTDAVHRRIAHRAAVESERRGMGR